MERVRDLHPPVGEPIDYEAAVNEMIREIDGLLEQVHRNHAKTERLRDGSVRLKDATDAILATLKVA